MLGSRRKLVDTDDFEDTNFEDIEISGYNNSKEYKSGFTICLESIKRCFGLGSGTDYYEYNGLELEDRSETDSFRHEIDMTPVKNRRSSSQAEDDNDFDDTIPAMDSTREQSDDDDEDNPHIETTERVIIEDNPVPVQLSSSSESSSPSISSESSSEELEEDEDQDEQDFSNMFCLKDINPKKMAQFMLDMNKHIIILRQIRYQYALTLKRAKLSPESGISAYSTENRIMIIDRLAAWYKKSIIQLEKFMEQAKQYKNWNTVFLTYDPDSYVQFVVNFILEKKDTIFLAQKEPHDLPVLPDLPQFLQ